MDVEIKDMAKQDYLKGFKYREIAERYEVSINTVKTWVRRGKWKRSKELNKKNMAASDGSTSKAAHEKTTKEVIEDQIKDKVTDDLNLRAGKIQEIHELEHLGLSEKELAFVYEYCRIWSGPRAVAKIWAYHGRAAQEKAARLLGRGDIQEAIDKLKRIIRESVGLEQMAIIQKYIDAAFADMRDFVRWGSVEIPVLDHSGCKIYDEEGEVVMKPVNFVRLQDDAQVDGTLIEEVKQGKEGVSIKLLSKEKALDRLEKYMDLIPDHHNRMIQEEKLKLQRERLEIEKAKDGQDDDNNAYGVVLLPEVEEVEGGE